MENFDLIITPEISLNPNFRDKIKQPEVKTTAPNPPIEPPKDIIPEKKVITMDKVVFFLLESPLVRLYHAFLEKIISTLGTTGTGIFLTYVDVDEFHEEFGKFGPFGKVTKERIQEFKKMFTEVIEQSSRCKPIHYNEKNASNFRTITSEIKGKVSIEKTYADDLLFQELVYWVADKMIDHTSLDLFKKVCVDIVNQTYQVLKGIIKFTDPISYVEFLQHELIRPHYARLVGFHVLTPKLKNLPHVTKDKHSIETRFLTLSIANSLEFTSPKKVLGESRIVFHEKIFLQQTTRK